MNVREWMNNNPAIMTIGAVVVLVICLGLIVMQLRPRSGASAPVDVYFYDLNDGKLFVASAMSYPPIDAPSGPTPNGKPAGVRAHVYGCGSCPSGLAGLTAQEVEAKGAKIAYLEMMTPQMKQAMENMDPNNPDAMYMDMMTGQLVRTLDNTNWYSYESQEGQNVYMVISNMCTGDDRPKVCFPGR